MYLFIIAIGTSSYPELYINHKWFYKFCIILQFILSPKEWTKIIIEVLRSFFNELFVTTIIKTIMNSYAVVAVLFNINIFWGSTNSGLYPILNIIWPMFQFQIKSNWCFELTSELLVVRIQYYYKVSRNISINILISNVNY